MLRSRGRPTKRDLEMIRSTLLHSNKHYRSGSSVLESGNGQTIRASGSRDSLRPRRHEMVQLPGCEVSLFGEINLVGTVKQSIKCEPASALLIVIEGVEVKHGIRTLI